MDRLTRDRLKWKCRRGLLELDLVLERLLARHADAMDEDEIARLSELLELADNELWDIANGRSERFDPRLGEVVERLRAS